MLWKKDAEVAPWVIRFTVGEDYRWDQDLLPYDVVATRAHVKGLVTAGIISENEFEHIGAALDDLLDRYREGEIIVSPEHEDCHTVIEGFLTSELGETGKKVHTGRSRNDQVLAALRLYLRDILSSIASDAIELGISLCMLATATDDWVMPGYTHTRQAMPSTLGAWAMGYAELLVGDVELLKETARRINKSPLGSAAGYGVPFISLPREQVAESLGFDEVQTHVTSVQLSRGKYELEVVHAVAQLTLTLSRLAADLILFSSSEFGFVSIPSALTTGSSIMPQKQNPDVLELVRAFHFRVAAEAQLLLTLPAGLISGYHRDLQLTKEAVMRSTTVGSDCLSAMGALLPGLTFNRKRMEEAVESDIVATHIALKNVTSGTAFRSAYRAAASNGHETMSIAEALEAYATDGSPGRSVPSLVWDRLEELQGEEGGI